MVNRLLLINNTIFYEEGTQLFLNKETGNFFVKLKELGNQVSAFQISQLKTEKDSFANFNIGDKAIEIFHIKRRKNRIVPFIKAFFKIQYLVRKHNFIYIFYPGPICQVIALFCNFYNKPYGIYVRGEQNIETKLSKFIFRKAKFVLTISPDFTRKISSFNSNSFTIRPMIGFGEEDIVKTREVVTGDQVRILYVGRLVVDKGLLELLEAVKALSAKGRHVYLSLVGGGSDFDILNRYVKSNSLDDYVHFCGMVSDRNQLKDIYMNNDIFILPSYHEGFPRVLYEAMMMHLPIITTFVGSIDFLMQDEVNCLKILPRDVNSIVEQIEVLLRNPLIAQVIADNGTDTIINYLKDKKEDHAVQLNKLIRTI